MPVALVTGGNGSIGAASSLALGLSGYHVVVGWIVDEKTADRTVSAIVANGGAASSRHVDVTSKASIEQCVSSIRLTSGRLDVLVNNAAINHLGLLHEITEQDWDEVLAVNLKGPFLLVQAAVPLMRQSLGASIINVCSEAGLSTLSSYPKNAAYTASKMGLLGLTRVLANALAPHIRVNAISPGWVKSSIHDNPQERERAGEVLQQIALQRFGEPNEIAAAVVFLSGPGASFITGQNLVVGGGRVFA